MNLLLTTVLAHPYVKMADMAVPICLPGIADDGFLYLTIKYVTPNIGIIFACMKPDCFHECLSKANIISQELKNKGLLEKITKEIYHNYVEKSPIVLNGKG